MSEIDVNLIRDEDVLRRMWQQTEDFGRKKEIRAHMYRLREERLRSLYSPDPTPTPTRAKGCEFSSSQAHVDSFADQTFQSMKSKEVRDAGSPPKEFSYRGQDQNELSNAGWTVESEDCAADKGRTRVQSQNANIEGSFHVEGGRGQFVASDRQRRAVTETEDAHGHTRREDTSAASARTDHVERRATDGSQHSSSISSSTTQHHSQQVSSTVQEASAIQDYDQTHDSNRNETITRNTNTERTLRSDDVTSGELVSRKIDYPDDRTKVIVETRCLPDGTRVTNTRREFRAPAHTAHSEYQTSSEIKSHSSQLKSDTREMSSKTTRHTTAGRIDDNIQDFRRTTDDIVDSQRHVDDNDFKRQLREYTIDDDTASELHRKNRRHETTSRKVTDHSQTNENFSRTHYETNVNNKVTDRSSKTRDVKDDYTQFHQQTTQRFVDNVDQTDRREVDDDSNISYKNIRESHTAKDRLRDSPRDGERPGPTPDDTTRNNNSYPNPKDNTELIHTITEVTDEKNNNRQVQDTKVEEVVERKISSDRYQTTYQSDFPQKKVSTDWSPTQQAWASSLRADTPPATRPSTRASSPGSKTFKSSTSSLRSSVSPDKYRKTPSRGPSPSKLDRCSPTRSVISDKVSSTRHSFFSINETTTNKHASPERKPPIGRAPGYHSPERNPESGRQRPSVSPEKRLQNLSSRPSVSPDRKPSNKALTNEYLRNTSPTRAAGIPSGARQSPDRQTHTGYPSPSSPQNSRSPERQLRTDISKSRTSTSPDRKRPIEYTNKPKGSPEREVGYRHPTPTNDPTKLNKQSVSPDRKPGYMRPTAASQHALGPSKPEDGPEKSSPSSDPMHSTSTMVREDHYKFIDEETKMNTRTDKIYDMHQGKATSPKKSPSKDSVLPLSNRRSPSPQKKIVIVNENDELYGKVDKTVELIDTTDTQTENVETKFGTYDKQKPRDITETTVITTSSPTKDVTYDTLRPRDKTSPKRGQEPTSPIKKSPKGSTSPTKSPTREARFKQTTDFINSEKTTEEINKKTISKEHPRQLVTPSSSPTRKPKFVEEEPSTGQSSPTTSVSGFVYFGSPREEKPIVTDLDEDFLPGTDTSNEPQYPRPESLNLLRSTSPSKIPCRSPSPEKRDSLTKDSFPRKSSLKKPSTFVNPSSPVDKPPTSFRISPTEDEPSLHKVVKKDYPSEPETTTPTRAKPPLTRRETYEDRCRLILGMMDTNTSECIKKTTPKSKKPDSNKSSPSVSPCDSPLHKEPSLFSDFSTEDKVVNTKSDVTSFISREQQDIIQTIKVNRGDKITETKTLQKSPEKESRSPSKSPERKTGGTSENNSSSIKLPHPSFSPQRTEPLPVRDSPDKILSGKRPKETSPTRTIKKTTYDETTTTENATSVDKNYLEEFTTSTKIRTRVLASPTRQTPKSSPAGQLTKPRHDGSPSRDTQSPQRTSERKPQESRTAKTLQDQSSEQTVSHKSRESPEKIASSIKCDTTAITEDHEEIYTSKTVDRKITKTSVCPTLPIEKSSPRSISPTKPSHPRNNVPKSDLSPDRKTFNLEYTKTTASSMEKEKPTSLKATDQKQTTSQYSESPKRKTSEPRTPSPIKSTRQPSATFTKKADTSPDRKPASKQPSSAKDDVTKKSQSQSPSRKPVNKLTEFTNTSTTVSSEHETNEYCNITTEDTQKKTTSTTGSILYPRKSPIHDSFKPIDKSSHEYPRSGSPTKPTEETPKRPEISPEHRSKPANESPYKLIPKKPEDKSTNTSKSSVSPDRKPSYMKSTASVSSKQGSNIKQDITLDSSTHKQSSTKSSTPQESQGTTPKDTHTKPEEPRQLRTPSPTKKNIKVTEVSTDLLMSEREQEILDRVQKSLRKLSPERKEKSPSRDKSPNKNTSSLQDLDITTTKSVKLDIGEKNYVKESCPEEPTKEMQEMPNKPSSRNTSPVKRTSSVLTSPNKSRSISPRKPLSQTDRPQSPRGARASGVRPRDQVPFNRKPTPANLSTYKIDNVTNGVIKQNVISKTNTTSKITTNRLVSPSKPNEPEIKRNATIKGIKENNKSPRKEVTRTSSDSNIKPKKAPQRMKSKPEIQVNDLSTKSPKYQKPIIKEPSKMPVKPKSATALNTPDNDDDIIIDVQQSKSSRENSPDRICPTPVNFTDDVGTPRFPDEVNEPDDEYRKRTYHTIHETETIVDDIVEICEDEELFVKKSDITSEYDDSLLSVTDKVNKFTTKIDSITKPKDASNIFKMNEQRGHSDLINDNLKTDESLLTVSEKVTKFVKGSGETKDNPSKFRKITDEYDNDTIYQDDYTKLSVNDKAHLFVETAENMKVSKAKPAQKVERPDLSNVDESLKKDDCLLSVSDKVNKFVKTAESFITETHEVDQKERKHKEQHDREDTNETYECNELTVNNSTNNDYDQPKAVKQETIPESNLKNSGTSKTNPADRMPTVKITTLRSSAAVKKAKELFENIASTQKKDASQNKVKTTKLTDIGVVKKSPKTDSTTVLHPSVEDVTPFLTETAGKNDACPYSPNSYERPSSGTFYTTRVDDKPRASPNRLTANSLEILRTKSPARQSKSPASQSKSPMRQTVETTGTTARTVLSRYPVAQNAENPRDRAKSPRVRPEPEKPDKVPGYLKPTKTSQNKEESKVEEDVEVSTRRGSGKFGVELRRTSLERSTISSERRRSVEHHQPCIEDIVELDLLEQMLEKVMGYEQRRRIRSQIRIVKNQSNHVETHKYVKTNHTTSSPRPRLPDQQTTRSPDRGSKQAAQRMSSPDRRNKTTLKKQPERAQPAELIVNGDAKEPPPKSASASLLRTHSPEKLASKSIHSAKSPIRQSSPVKKRTVSPTKNVSAQRANRFNEYATAYMKKVDSNQMNKVKLVEKKTKKTTDTKQTFSHETQDRTSQEFTTTNSFSVKSERTPSRDVIEILQTNGKRSPSPKKETGVWPKPQSPERRVYSPAGKTVSPERAVHSPVSKAPERKVNSPISKISERKPQSPERNRYSPIRKSSESERRTVSPERKVTSPAERLYQRSPSPEFKRQRPDPKKETIIKVYEIEKKIPSKPVQDVKPSWVTNRNLKKITSETRTFNSKKPESEKPKYLGSSPSMAVCSPTDVITSSYGPGPLDAAGRPLFGIRALRNGASTVHVKGTVIRQEFHSSNGSAPEGTMSVTAYSSQPEELERLLAGQKGSPPSRVHGLAAITTTKKFGGDTGISMSSVNTKEERASLDQFTHIDRKTDSRIESLHSHNFETQENIDDMQRIASRKTNSSDRQEKRREERVTEVRKGDKAERREDKKTVRQSSVKSLTEKFIKSAHETGKAERGSYPKAGLILRTTSVLRDADDTPPGLGRADGEQSIGSTEDVVVSTSSDRGVTTTTRTSRHHGPTTTHQHTTTVTHREPLLTKTSTLVRETHEPGLTRTVTCSRGERSFLDSSTKVSGVQDILTRMRNADIVIEDGDTVEDAEARALLNKFLGASVLMAGMQDYVSDQPHPKVHITQESVRSSSGGSHSQSARAEELDLENCWDEKLLRKLLDECTDYEQRRRLRARIRSLMAEQEACAAAVTEALGAAHITTEAESGGAGTDADAREEEEVTVTTSVRRNSSEKTTSSSTTKTSKVTQSVGRPAPQPVSPFAKFRQLEKQNSTNSPSSPVGGAASPQSPGSPQPYFKFTDPALQCSALTIKERLLQWCRDKTRDYENVKLENFSTSWADGLAFCALLHHFLPDAFDYSQLTPATRRHNFTLAFKVADEKAGIYPLLDVDDMVAMRKPDWKCVFTYVQSIYRRFKDEA